MSFKHGEIHWTELNTHDPEKAAGFYRDILGWEIDSMPMPRGGTYRVGKAGGEMAAGIFEMTEPHMADLPSHWLSYFAVEDADKAAEAVVEAGGTVLRAPWDIPGVGRIALVKDSVGAVCGLMQPTD